MRGHLRLPLHLSGFLFSRSRIDKEKVHKHYYIPLIFPDECCIACIDSSSSLHLYSLLDLGTILTTGPIDLSGITGADFEYVLH